MLTPKNRKPRRVDMSRELRRTLLRLRNARVVEALAHGKADISDLLVFQSEAGTPIEMNNFSERVFKPLLTIAGLRCIRFHDLRHTYGSLHIQAGASLAYVRDQMGHSLIQVTADTYGHLIPGANITFVDKLDSLAHLRRPPGSAGVAVVSPQMATSRSDTERTPRHKCRCLRGFDGTVIGQEDSHDNLVVAEKCVSERQRTLAFFLCMADREDIRWKKP